MRLRHLHLPGLTSYTHASRLQDILVASLLAHKYPEPAPANPSSSSSVSKTPSSSPAPDPTIITAQFHPVYTCGRREVNTVSEEQKAYLRSTGAEFHPALRGGQTTFHGPGQLIAYPILDLRRHGLSPRNHVCLLEKTLIATCARYGIQGFTTENPGVWVSDEKKIAALGVHVRRGMTSHGVGLNVNTDLDWFKHIVACGLVGKSTTNFRSEGVEGVEVESVGEGFVEEIARRLEGVEGVVGVSEAEVLREAEDMGVGIEVRM
ncbi:MAG: hypothetical protein M1819_003712 [Sarea resinae]|nr:MAG: hypothetical protein M1819_003712 [Sarea resinae]